MALCYVDYRNFAEEDSENCTAPAHPGPILRTNLAVRFPSAIIRSENYGR
jgi:hypothetical protein